MQRRSNGETELRRLADRHSGDESPHRAVARRSESAPARLRSWLSHELGRRRARRRRLSAAVAATGAAAAALVLALVVPGGEQGATVAEAAGLGERPPAQPAPRQSREEYLLSAAVEDVQYPNWHEHGWRALGSRSDRLDGRIARTVFYARDGHRIAYTIVAGRALPVPTDGRRSNRSHVALMSFAADGRQAVTWRRKRHTCVLSGSGVRPETLVRLASWKAGGRIPY